MQLNTLGTEAFKACFVRVRLALTVKLSDDIFPKASQDIFDFSSSKLVAARSEDRPSTLLERHPHQVSHPRVAAINDESSPGYVPLPERIATFDIEAFRALVQP